MDHPSFARSVDEWRREDSPATAAIKLFVLDGLRGQRGISSLILDAAEGGLCDLGAWLTSRAPLRLPLLPSPVGFGFALAGPRGLPAGLASGWTFRRPHKHRRTPEDAERPCAPWG